MKHTISDLADGNDGKRTLNILAGSEVTIYTPDKDGFEQPICSVEIWEGKLQVLAWPDAEDANSGPIITEIRNLS